MRWIGFLLALTLLSSGDPASWVATDEFPGPGDLPGPDGPVFAVADVIGEVTVHLHASRPRDARLGQLLQPGDRIEVGIGAAWVLSTDGGLRRLGRGETWTVGTAHGPEPLSLGLDAEALALVGDGLRIWAGTTEPTPAPIDSSVGPVGVELLSPRSEMVFDRRPGFYWAGEGPVRVVVVRDEKVLWRSVPYEGSFVRYPRLAKKVVPGVLHEWWLESPAGVRLTPRSAFQLAPEAFRASTVAFEEAVSRLEASTGRPVVSDLLRCAYYRSIGAWSRVLEAAYDLPDTRAARTFADRTTETTRGHLGLGGWSTTYLVGLRVWQRLDI